MNVRIICMHMKPGLQSRRVLLKRWEIGKHGVLPLTVSQTNHKQYSTCFSRTASSSLPHHGTLLPCADYTQFHLANSRVNSKCKWKPYSTHADEGMKSGKQQMLLLAIYASFGMGACLLAAVIYRELQKKRLQWKGVFEMDVAAWQRVKLYKYKDFALPHFVVNKLDEIQKFETSADDVWLVSFPRSGTTWLQEITFLIHSDMNFDAANTRLLDDRFPYFEFMYPGIEAVAGQAPPRLIKSHLPWSLLPDSVKEKEPKIIYIARNPKDVVVSYFYFARLLFPVTRYNGKFDEFFELFLQDKVMYTPWWKHVLEFWDKRNEENVLFLTYEDLKKDTAGTIDKVAKFLGKTVTEVDKQRIIEHCSFERMKSNKMTNHSWFETLGVSDPKEGDFIRKGCVGDWTNHLSKEMNHKMNKMVHWRFNESDINFAYQGTHFVQRQDEEDSVDS